MTEQGVQPNSGLAKEAAAAAPEILAVVSPLAWVAFRLGQSLLEGSRNASPSATQGTESQRLQLEATAARARAAQEFALAVRITSADEVEIEEHYEGSGEGFAGMEGKVDDGVATAKAGAGGKGQVLRRRIVRLKGGAPAALTAEQLQQVMKSGTP